MFIVRTGTGRNVPVNPESLSNGSDVRSDTDIPMKRVSLERTTAMQFHRDEVSEQPHESLGNGG